MGKLFVALAGNIGAGKTTAARLLSGAFGYEPFDERVIDIRTAQGKEEFLDRVGGFLSR